MISISELAESSGMPLWMVYVYLYVFQGDPINQLYVFQYGDDDDIVLYDADHSPSAISISLKEYLDNKR